MKQSTSLRAFLGKRSTQWTGILVVLIFAVTLPLYANIYVIGVAWNALFYMLLALGCNVIVGYAGLCDLGYSSKVAIGAYTTAILMKTFGWNFWATLPVSILASAIIACLVGMPTLRLRGDYLAIVTLGFSEIIRLVARNLNVTGSASGISGIKSPVIFGVKFSTPWMQYFIFLILVIIFIFVSLRLKRSRFDRALEYMREDEDAARAMGVNVPRFKLLAFVIGSVMGGLAGSFYAVKMGSFSPSYVTFTESAYILLIVVLGGMGKTPGMLLGATLFIVLQEIFRNVGNSRMLIFGILLVLIMIFRPQGIWPDKRPSFLPSRRERKQLSERTETHGTG